MTTRHTWTKLETHHYRCARCGMDKANVILPEPTSRGWAQWETRFSRDGATWTGATPPCPGVLPGSEPAPEPAPELTPDPEPVALVWTRLDRYVERSDRGQRVSASQDAAGWMFTAWGADVAPELKYYEWPPLETAKVTYRRGEHVPQRCALLGVFASAEAARDACAVDAARQGFDRCRADETRPAITPRTEEERVA